MRKKSGLTIIEQAIVLVPEFENVVRKLDQQVALRGQSKSTLNNYMRRIALFVVNFGKLPEQIDPEEINEYLAALARGQVHHAVALVKVFAPDTAICSGRKG
jgi:integrase/recombinase XerD